MQISDKSEYVDYMDCGIVILKRSIHFFSSQGNTPDTMELGIKWK